MVVLGIETSCDETSVAVVRDGREVLSNVICSQIDLHAKFGGIVPEVASRKHVELINPALDEAMAQAGVGWAGLDGVAVTHGPGLVGSLLVGVATAKAIAYTHDLPLIAVNHLEGHIYSNFLIHDAIQFPVLNLIVSGGHSDLIVMESHGTRANPYGHYARIGRARDDAAGEAFDKVARALDLGFPGGPAIERAAAEGDAHAVDFPVADLDDSFDFSFSGLKTAVFRRVQGFDAPKGDTRRQQRGSGIRGVEVSTADIAASFQGAVVEALVGTTLAAAEACGVPSLAVAGGVSANRALREAIRARSQEMGVDLFIPPLGLCTDNAGMIACAGFHRIARGERSGLDFDTYARLPLGVG
jgi:N6-L-threonylcarbamoyladenine synthase